jgi:hypothetical protein
MVQDADGLRPNIIAEGMESRNAGTRWTRMRGKNHAFENQIVCGTGSSGDECFQ